jgi:plasmid stabilization system protein ParE
MARGSKQAYSDKQKRQAEYIAEGYENRGVSDEEAKRRAWATVNKETGGGKKSGSGRGHSVSHESSRKGGRIGGHAMSHAERSRAAKKGWETRRRKSHASS